jgi:prevent-host-death family protein
MARIRKTSVGLYDAKTHFSRLMARVEDGEEVTITRHGTPVARLVPVRRTLTPNQRRLAIDRWRRLSKQIRLRGLKIRDLIDEGRP